ncbi:carbohydrate ABC transporter permease [Vallitalea okinawensis]|uniref:carbohydrate ABC transporter permease n=1 Tax=Vallitalea okinawensis TaxID=2078660 RepID=UPI0013001881|nr:sugar ABC transporter permease [Vallitalea okinawensis]
MKKAKVKREWHIALIFLLPSLIGFSIFYFFPFLNMLKISTVDPVTSRFIGLFHYKDLLNNNIFQIAFRNQMVLMGLSIPLIIVISLIIAVLLERLDRQKNFIMSAMVIPLVIPTASVLLFWRILFHSDGTINTLLNLMNVDSVFWLNSEMTRIVIVIMFLWKNVGYNVVLFMAGLKNIPKHYYECGKVEGANEWYLFRKITIIYLMPTTFFVFIISIVNSFKMFREIFLLFGAYPHLTVYSLQHYMNNLFIYLDVSKLTAASILLILSIFIIVFIFFKLQSKLIDSITHL